MASKATKRLLKASLPTIPPPANLIPTIQEISALEADPILDVIVKPSSEVTTWWGYMSGSYKSPYKGGKFAFKINFSNDFPFKAPEFKFTTKVYHPGINGAGEVCLSVLRDQWKPGTTMREVLMAVYNKLNDPQPDDPFEPEIAQVLRDNAAKFNQTAAEWTKIHASAEPKPPTA